MPVLGDTIQVTHFCYCSDLSQASENVHHYVVTAVAGAGLSDLVLAQDMGTAFSALYAALMPLPAEYVSCSVQHLKPLPRLPAQYSNAAPLPGAATDEMLPSQVAGLIDFGNGTSVRSARGRSYVGFMARDFLDTVLKFGEVNAAGLAALQALGNQIAGVHTYGAGGNTVTLSYGALSKVTGTFTPLSTVTPSRGFATQKRRGFFGKKNVLPA